MEENKYYFRTYEQEWNDYLELINKIKEDNWVEPNTVIINCSPDYSSILCQMLNHKLSHINHDELFEQLALVTPYPVMSQVWNNEEEEYIQFRRYLITWAAKNIVPSYKYLFVTSAILTGKNFKQIKEVLKSKLEPNDYRFASCYMSNNSDFKPDYYVHKYDGKLLLPWQNSNNPNV